MTYSTDHGTLLCGDVMEQLQDLPDESVHCVVTSPPYWGLRDYGVDGQIGLEATPEEYLERMVAVFGEVRRVLHPSGTCWVNMGDKMSDKQLLGQPWRLALALQADGWWLRRDIIWHKPNPMPESCTDRPTTAHEYLFLLTKQARYFFDMDAIRTPLMPKTLTTRGCGFGKDENDSGGNVKAANFAASMKEHKPRLNPDGSEAGAAIRSVWTIPTFPLPEAHFATFPPEIPRKCILAGTSLKGVCPECGEPWRRVVNVTGGTIGQSWHDHKGDGELGQRAASAAKGGHGYKRTTTDWQPGCACNADEPIPATVLDPFMGAGTTALVAEAHRRRWIGIELNPEYCEMAMARIRRGLDAPRKRRKEADMPLLEVV